MRHFLALGQNPDSYYSQENNPTEQILRKQGVANFLVSCGPTAAVSLIHACGYVTEFEGPGKYAPQPEEVLTGYFNDPRNAKRLESIRSLSSSEWLGNTIPQWYEPALWDVFGVRGVYREGLDFHDITLAIMENIGIMACLKKPGHFIAITGFDDEKGTIIYNDPWPGNYWPAGLKGTPGFMREINWDEMAWNFNPWRVEIG